MKKLEIENLVRIGNLLDVMSERMNLSFDEVETMAFHEGVYPTGFLSSISRKFPMSEDKKLSCEIKKLLEEINIDSIRITEL